MSEARLRVLELGLLWGLGGTEQAIELRASLLSKQRFDVRAVAVHGGGPRWDRLVERGIQTVELGGDMQRLRSLIAEFRPHVVAYSRGERRCGFSQAVQDLCQEAGTPVLAESNIFGRPAGWEQKRPPNVVGHVSLSSMLRCARGAGGSMQSLAAAGHRAMYMPVPTQGGAGVDLGRDRASVRAQLGVAPSTLLACRTSRPDLRKWSIRLELALPRLFEAVPELRFIFMAAPPHKAASLKRRFGERVLCLEPTSELTKLIEIYRASDLMIHSSGIGEGYGVSMAEAMYYGLPVVVDSTPNMDNGQVEVVEHGRTGLVVASSSGFVVAAQLLSQSPELRATLSQNAHERAAARFGDLATTRQWERVYIEACRAAGVALEPALAEHAQAIDEMPTAIEHDSFPEIYEQKCRNVLGLPADPRERALGRLLRARDTLDYARQIGFQRTARVIAMRLRSSGTLRRD